MVGRGGARRKPGRQPTGQVGGMSAVRQQQRAGEAALPPAIRRRPARRAPGTKARQRRMCTLSSSAFGRPATAFCHAASGTVTATSVWLGSTVTAGVSAISCPPWSL